MDLIDSHKKSLQALSTYVVSGKDPSSYTDNNIRFITYGLGFPYSDSYKIRWFDNRISYIRIIKLLHLYEPRTVHIKLQTTDGNWLDM